MPKLAMFLAIGVISVTTALAGAGSSAARGTERYPAFFERTFMQGCSATSGGRATMCRCALRWLERHYSYTALLTIYRHDRARFNTIAVRAIRACIR
jgi:hypothetical protein